MKAIQVLVAVLMIKCIYNTTWSYTNQAAWYQNGTWPACVQNGTGQSPINVVRTSLTQDLTTAVDIPGTYNTVSGLKIKNAGGQTAKVEGAFGTTTFNNKVYTMLQFHTHQPAEHTFDGYKHDMELHFVHQQGTNSDYLVLTVFFNIGAESQFLKDINYCGTPTTADATAAISKSINVWDALSKANNSGEYITYAGGFTTPPCTEGVTFVMFREYLTMSKAQWDCYATTFANQGVNYATGAGTIRTAIQQNRTVTLKLGKMLGSNLIKFVGALATLSLMMFIN